VPFLVDGLAVLGLIGRSSKFAASTRRAGLVLTLGAGWLSLTCNIMPGHNLGQQLYGVLVVAGFIATETYATKLRPPTAAPAEPTAEEPARGCREVPPVRGRPQGRRHPSPPPVAATRRRNAEAAAKSEPVAVRNARRALATAN
jgi:hypothetical protein